MTAKPANKGPQTTLSYSRISTFKGCSWVYFSRYITKLPSIDNKGNVIGNVTHSLIECLAQPKRESYTKKILVSKKLPRSVIRLAAALLKKAGFYSKDNLRDTILYLKRFLRYDFQFHGAAKVLPPEFHFELKTATYKTRGFIDRAAFYKDADGDTYVVIRDAKTQKVNFTEAELDESMQALMYLLAIKTIYPEVNVEKSRVEFVMLKFPKDFIKKVEGVTEETLEGLVAMLEMWQVKMDAFTKKDATKNFAAAKGWTKGFDGLTKCGKPMEWGMKKADGDPAWVCDCKLPRTYWVLLDSAGKVLTSANKESDLRAKKGQRVEERWYTGCPFFFKDQYRT